MKILLTGANGFIGGHIAQALRAQSHEIVAISRTSGHDFAALQTPAAWLPLLQGVDAVVNSVGIIAEQGAQRFDAVHAKAPVALFQACAQLGIQRVVQISAVGTDEQAFSRYHLTKKIADDTLRSLNLEHTILRLGMVYGKNSSSGALFMQMAKLPLIPVLGDGQQTLQPVHVSDVVAMVQVALQGRSVAQTIDVIGPDSYTFCQWLQRFREALGLGRARFVHVPFGLVLMASRVGRYLNPMLQPDNLRMLQTSYHADPQALVAYLGRAPLAATNGLFFQ